MPSVFIQSPTDKVFEQSPTDKVFEAMWDLTRHVKWAIHDIVIQVAQEGGG